MKPYHTFFICLICATLFLFGCAKPDETNALNWEGVWTIQEFAPQDNAVEPIETEGEIIANGKDKVQIKGSLFNLYSSLLIEANIESRSLVFKQNDADLKIEGSGALTTKDRIDFRFSMTDIDSDQEKLYVLSAQRK